MTSSPRSAPIRCGRLATRRGAARVWVLLAAVIFVVSGCDAGTPHAVDRVESEDDFLARMVPHHEEAVAAAEQLLDGTEREQLRMFARDIIGTQTTEIEQMVRWLDQWHPDRDTHGGHEPVIRDLPICAEMISIERSSRT